MRSRETLLRRHLKRQGISVHDYRAWVGAPATESVEDFFLANPTWDVAKWKALVIENRARVRGLAKRDLSQDQIQESPRNVA